MLSRVADALYWLGRYIERADNVARFMDVNLHLMLDSVEDTEEPWEPLVAATGDHAAFAARYGRAARDAVIRFLTFDVENPNSIVSCLRVARENARSVREAITQEMWEQLNRFYWTVTAEEAAARAMAAAHDFFTGIKAASQLFSGSTEATMARNEAWHFLRLGCMIERADKTTRILDVKAHLLGAGRSPSAARPRDVHWSAVLHSASAIEMYRKRHGIILPEKVVEFLLLDREFPRSAQFCLIHATESLHAITGTGPGMFRNRAEQLLGQLRSELAYSRVEEILEHGLHEYLDALQVKLNRLGDAIFETFFALPPARTPALEAAMAAAAAQ